MFVLHSVERMLHVPYRKQKDGMGASIMHLRSFTIQYDNKTRGSYILYTH